MGGKKERSERKHGKRCNSCRGQAASHTFATTYTTTIKESKSNVLFFSCTATVEWVEGYKRSTSSIVDCAARQQFGMLLCEEYSIHCFLLSHDRMQRPKRCILFPSPHLLPTLIRFFAATTAPCVLQREKANETNKNMNIRPAPRISSQATAPRPSLPLFRVQKKKR